LDVLWRFSVPHKSKRKDRRAVAQNTRPNYYDKAFKRAGLDFSGTHIMRHGGTRLVYNQFSDLEVAKQLLGNSDMDSVLTYAVRDTGALNKVARLAWKK
jgi:integrase